MQSDAEFIKLIGELGPPPPTKKKGASDAGAHFHSLFSTSFPHLNMLSFILSTDDDDAAAAAASGGASGAVDERTLDLVDIGLRNLLENANRFDTSLLEAAKFFYKRGATKTGSSVFYLILNRMSLEMLAGLDAMSLHVVKQLGNTVHSEPFVLIVDLSWFKVSDGFQVALHRQIMNLSTLFSARFFSLCSVSLLCFPFSCFSCLFFQTFGELERVDCAASDSGNFGIDGRNVAAAA